MKEWIPGIWNSMAANVPIVHPDIAGSGDIDDLVLTTTQVEQWREEGYLLIDGVFSDPKIRAAVEDIKLLQMSKTESAEFEVGDGKTFPTKLHSLDALTLDERFLAAVQQLLGTADVRMSQAETWKKVATAVGAGGTSITYSNQDQRMHMDFPNHTLVHPPVWENPEAVAVIVYLSEGTDCGGATRVVPRLKSPAHDELYEWPYCNMPGFGEIPWMNDRGTVEEYLQQKHPSVAAFREKLYAREKTITYSPGTVLFYRHDLWHRGTPLLPGSERFVQNLVFKRTNCDWLNNWNRGTAYSMYDRDMYVERLIAGLSVRQRGCLGFPAPGSTYWTPATLQAVKRRYEPLGMDFTPYECTLKVVEAAAAKADLENT